MDMRVMLAILAVVAVCGCATRQPPTAIEFESVEFDWWANGQ